MYSIITKLSNIDVGCKAGVTRVNSIAYVDDLVLLATDLSALNALYRALGERLDGINMLLKASMSKCIIFHENLHELQC